MADTQSVVNSNEMLAGGVIEKDERFHNFRLLFPNGSFRELSTQEVLLCEILQELRQLREDLKARAS